MQQQEEKPRIPLRQGQFLPSDPFRRIIQEYIADQTRLWDGSDGSSVLAATGSAGVLLGLATKIWPDSEPRDAAKLLHQIRHNAKWTSFDVADRIVIATENSWHDDPELSELWDTVDLSVLDMKDPTCAAVEEEFRRQMLELFEAGESKHDLMRRFGIGWDTLVRYLTGTSVAPAA